MNPLIGLADYVYHVYRYGTLAEAAEVMGKTKSAVGYGVRMFERHYGRGPLFVRTIGDRMVPTEEADRLCETRLVPYVEGMALDRAGDPKLQYRLRVGGPDLLLREYVGPAARQLQKKHAGLYVEQRVGARGELDELLALFKVNLLVVCAAKEPVGCSWHPFLPVQPAFFVAKGSRYKSAEMILQDAKRPPLISPPTSEAVCASLRQLAEERGCEFEVQDREASAAAVPLSIKRGGGVGLGVTAASLPIPGGVVALPLPVPPLQVAAIWRGKAGPFAQELVRVLDAIARRIAAAGDGVLTELERSQRRGK